MDMSNFFWISKQLSVPSPFYEHKAQSSLPYSFKLIEDHVVVSAYYCIL